MDRNRWKALLVSALGQGGSAVLTLLYLRAAVRGFSPEAYGLASAWLGTHTLLRGLLLLPLLQLYVFHFQSKVLSGEASAFAQSILRALVAMGLLATLLALAGLHAFPPTSSRWWIGGLAVGGLGLAEGLKTLGLTHLNHQERHGAYALAMLGDSGLRILLLYLCLALGGKDALLLVLVPLLGAGAFALLLGGPLRDWRGPSLGSFRDLIRSQAAFLAPLIFFAFTSWTTGMADRYLLLQWAGEGPTGLYSAIYGLFGTPFPLLISTLVLVFRPQLSAQAVGEGLAAAYRRTYRHYMTISLGAILLLALLLWGLQEVLGAAFLRPAHLAVLPILPWILLGQACFAGGQLFELEFYLRDRLSLVVLKQGCGMAAALAAMFILIPAEGILGAAKACTWYYGAECLVGGALFLWHRRFPRR